MRKLLALAAFLLSAGAYAQNPPSILNNTDHIVVDATAALTALGITYSGTTGPSSGTLAVNQTCATGSSCYGSPFLDASVIIANALNIGMTEYAANSSSTVTPSVTYQVINQSSTSYTLASYEQPNYNALEAGGVIYSMAYCGRPQTGDYPPVAFVTALPNQFPNGPVPVITPGGTTDACGAASGIEFSAPTTCSAGVCTWNLNGTQVDADSPSGTQEAVTAVLAALKSNHPSWIWGDVKAALRQTASNWSTGYAALTGSGSSTALGYGNINYSAANALSTASTFYLQPPGASIANRYSYAQITIYPFQQTRRVGEALYVFTSNPSSALATLTASNNQLTYSQITTLLSGSGGSLVWQSTGSPTTAQTVIYYPTASTSGLWFVAFTVDNATLSSANFSRGESFSTLASGALVFSASCLRQ